MNLFHILKKNFKLLIRAKASSLVVVLAPLVIFLLIIMAYHQTETYHLKIGIFSEEKTDLLSLVSSLQEFQIVEYNSSQSCLDDLKTGKVNTCLFLPKDFNLEGNQPKEVTFYVDQSQINLVWMISDTIKEKYNLKSKEISQGLVEDILNKLKKTKSKIEENQGIITQGKSSLEQGNQQVEEAVKNLQAIDLNFQLPSLNTSFDDLKNLTEEKINSIKGKINSAKGEINSLEINASETEPIVKGLEETINLLDELKGVIEKEETRFRDILINFQNSLNEAKRKLDDLANKKTEIAKKVENIKTYLNEGEKAFSSLKTVFEEINKEVSDLKISDPKVIASPLHTKVKFITTETTPFTYLFPSLLILVIMFVTLLLGTSLVMMEKHNPAYFRNFISPVKSQTFILGIYLTIIILIIVQLLIIFGLSYSFLSGISFGQLATIFLVLFLVASVFTFFGMIVGYLFSSEETGILASIGLGAIFLLFSGLILPLEAIPTQIREVVSYNPFVISETILKSNFLMDLGISPFYLDLIILALYVLILFILTLTIEKRIYQQVVYRVLHKQKKRT